jgi:hypothetical protein
MLLPVDNGRILDTGLSNTNTTFATNTAIFCIIPMLNERNLTGLKV